MVIRFHYKSRIYFSLRLIDGKKLLLGKLLKKKDDWKDFNMCLILKHG